MLRSFPVLLQDQRANAFESLGSNAIPLDQSSPMYLSAIRTIPAIGPNLSPTFEIFLASGICTVVSSE